MADEIVTQPDTTTLTTDVVDAPAEQQTAPDAKAGGEGEDKAKPEDGADKSVLGGDLKDEDDKAADAKDGDKPVGAPEKYDLKLEGIELDRQTLDDAEPIFRELNLDNDQANKLMPVAKVFAERTRDATIQQIIDAGAQQKKDWLDAFKADPEIGGAKTEETTHLAAKALDALGYPEGSDFRKVLTETGFGNHPEMIRAMRKIGEMVSEDGFVRGGAAAPTTNAKSTLYPND